MEGGFCPSTLPSLLLKYHICPYLYPGKREQSKNGNLVGFLMREYDVSQVSNQPDITKTMGDYVGTFNSDQLFQAEAVVLRFVNLLKFH